MQARLWARLPVLALLVSVSCGPHPSSSLAKAAFEGEAAKVRDLLAKGADPNGAEGPLILAARAGQVTVIQILLRAGADPNQRGGVNDWTVLMHAVHKNQEGAAVSLLEGGADPNAATGHGETPLMMAAGYGQTGMVRILLSHGADPRAKDVHGASALDNALTGTLDIDDITLGRCRTETVRALLDAAPDLAREVHKWPQTIARLGRCREALQLIAQRRGTSATPSPH